MFGGVGPEPVLLPSQCVVVALVEDKAVVTQLPKRLDDLWLFPFVDIEVVRVGASACCPFVPCQFDHGLLLSVDLLPGRGAVVCPPANAFTDC